LGSTALVAGLITLPTHGRVSLPLAGAGLIFLMAAVTLMASGTLGELVYKLGDVRPEHFARLSVRTVGGRSATAVVSQGNNK
jgi:hypothetical protein